MVKNRLFLFIFALIAATLLFAAAGCDADSFDGTEGIGTDGVEINEPDSGNETHGGTPTEGGFGGTLTMSILNVPPETQNSIDAFLAIHPDVEIIMRKKCSSISSLRQTCTAS